MKSATALHMRCWLNRPLGYNMTRTPWFRKVRPFYSSNTKNPEEIWQMWQWICTSHLKNVTKFTLWYKNLWSKLHRPPPKKMDGLENNRWLRCIKINEFQISNITRTVKSSAMTYYSSLLCYYQLHHPLHCAGIQPMSKKVSPLCLNFNNFVNNWWHATTDAVLIEIQL